MKLAIGLILLCLVLQGVANLLGSTRGEQGFAVMACVLGAAWAVQRILHREGLDGAGVRMEIRGLGLSVTLCAALIAVAVVYIEVTDVDGSTTPNSALLMLGILFQGGVAEELVFRGYLFGHLRRTRSFWRASWYSVLPFAAMHIFAFLTLDWAIALSALLLSIALSFPYAYLYELSGRTIWAPALLHAVTQAGPKLSSIDDPRFPYVWMVAALAVSWCVFLMPRGRPA